jgi:hypothetical protein
MLRVLRNDMAIYIVPARGEPLAQVVVQDNKKIDRKKIGDKNKESLIERFEYTPAGSRRRGVD